MKAAEDIKRFESSDASLPNLFGFVYLHSQHELIENDFKEFDAAEWEQRYSLKHMYKDKIMEVTGMNEDGEEKSSKKKKK